MKKIFFNFMLVLVVIVASQVVAGAQTQFSLRDFGGIGDGVTDAGPALRRAGVAMKAYADSTLVVEDGKYAILTPVAWNFAGTAARRVTVRGASAGVPIDVRGNGRGLGLGAEFIVKVGSAETMWEVTGLADIIFKDIGFTGVPDVNTDAQVVLLLNGVNAVIDHCEFYGLASLVPGGHIIFAWNTRLQLVRSAFLGCTTNSGLNTNLVHNLFWRHIEVTDTKFIDYGERPELYSKTPLAPAYSWVGWGTASGHLQPGERRHVVLRNLFMDEGAYFPISSRPDFHNHQPAAPIELVYISQLRMNVNNLGVPGMFIRQVDGVLIERSRFGWSRNANAAFDLWEIRDHAIVDNTECVDHAHTIATDGATRRLSVINSTYAAINSGAQIQRVLNVVQELDPVVYVRNQFQSQLGREPSPLEHYDWSDRLLECDGQAACEATAQSELRSYIVLQQPRTNVAAQSAGATFNASSFYDEFGRTAAFDGNRVGAYWSDSTSLAWPDEVEITFAGVRNISEIDIFGAQDDFGLLPPTREMSCSQYCLSDYDVQYWNGTQWRLVPGGAVRNNLKVWKQLTFSPLRTSRIRVIFYYSFRESNRLVELEAWTSQRLVRLPQ